MKESDILKCQIQEWYPRFRRETLRTIIHVLPVEFVDYLLEDGLFLSRSSDAMPKRTVVTCPELQSEDYDHWEEEDDEEGEPDVPAFPELERDVKASVERLGGTVFPKLNWSAPKDTTWISTTGDLRCRNFAEISLLLKASDRVAHDLCHAFDSCQDKTRDRPEVVVLALRKWYDLRPELEFRAFVVGGVLVGICQREVTGFYPSLVGREDEFESAIADFFHEVVQKRFEADRYVFDCYVTKDWTVKLLDFNPWNGPTLPLLFTWEELEVSYARISSEVVGLCAPITEDSDVERIQEGLEAVTLASSTGDRKGTRTGKNFDDGVMTAIGNVRDASESPARPTKEDFQHRREYRVETRIVMSDGLVQPGMRIATGIPIDLVDRGNWEEVIRREAAEEQKRENCAAGA